jgi:hypothetical protein
MKPTHEAAGKALKTAFPLDTLHFKENASAQMQALQAGPQPRPLTDAEIEQIEKMEMRDWHIKNCRTTMCARALPKDLFPREWNDALVPTKEMLKRDRILN